MTRLLAIMAMGLVGACTNIPDSEPMETGADALPPQGCIELRKREGPDAC